MPNNQVPKPQGKSTPEIRNTPGSRQPGTSSAGSLTSIRPPKK